MTWSSKQVISKEDLQILNRDLLHMVKYIKLSNMDYRNLDTIINLDNMTLAGTMTDTLKNILINHENA